MNDLLHILKTSTLSTYEILSTQVSPEALTEAHQELILERLKSECQVTSLYFNLLESSQGSIDELWGIWFKVQENTRLIQNFCTLKLSHYAKSEGYEEKIVNYFSSQGVIQSLISNRKLWWRKREGNIEIYSLTNNSVVDSFPLLSTRQILLQEVKIKPAMWFEVYLTHLLTEDFREQLMTQWVFSELIKRDEVKNATNS